MFEPLQIPLDMYVDFISLSLSEVGSTIKFKVYFI